VRSQICEERPPSVRLSVLKEQLAVAGRILVKIEKYFGFFTEIRYLKLRLGENLVEIQKKYKAFLMKTDIRSRLCHGYFLIKFTIVYMIAWLIEIRLIE
jgi:hypothetical protein